MGLWADLVTLNFDRIRAMWNETKSPDREISMPKNPCSSPSSLILHIVTTWARNTSSRISDYLWMRPCHQCERRHKGILITWIWSTNKDWVSILNNRVQSSRHPETDWIGMLPPVCHTILAPWWYTVPLEKLWGEEIIYLFVPFLWQIIHSYPQ